MSKQKFRFIDLMILTVIATAIEVVSVVAFNAVNVQVGTYRLGQALSLSLACLIGMIAVFRWNGYGLCVGVIAGVGSLLARMFCSQQLSIQMWLSSSLSYLGLVSCLLFIHKRDKKKMAKDKGMMVLYFFIGFFSYELLRILLLIGSENYFALIGNVLSFEIVNLLLSFVIYLIALRQDGLVVDMNLYLLEMQDIRNRVKRREDICVEELCEQGQINEAALLDGGTLSTEDLKELEDNRRRIEGKSTFFDEENKAVEKYRKKREELKNGKL